MSVGGFVTNIVPLPDKLIRVETVDCGHPRDPRTCIDIDDCHDVQFGDTIWWQGGKAYWSRKDEFSDRPVFMRKKPYLDPDRERK
jgi:hypothetical protein